MDKTTDGIMTSAAKLLGRSLDELEARYAPRSLYACGSMALPLSEPRVAIVGSRKASQKGLEAAQNIAGELARNGIVIVSGLAEGIDTAAHRAAIGAGKTIAVLGTPLNRAYPRENIQLQKEIMRDHLAISQYAPDHATCRQDFVLRDRTMALISHATIIVEAGESSGSLYAGWEAIRLRRPLFIWNPAVNGGLSWPQDMLGRGAKELLDPLHVLESIPSASLQAPSPQHLAQTRPGADPDAQLRT